MKQVSKLSLLALAILVAGCNEKVSPELQEGNSTTPDDPSNPVAPDEYYFSIVNTSDTLLNYKLHKTGAGNATKKCEVRSTTQLSNDIFRGDPAANDITCYFDAEELSLYHSGFSFEVQASKNTCDFVGYMPYGYYNRIPGDSTATYLQMSCMSDETNDFQLGQGANDRGLDITDSTGSNVQCGDWIIDGSIIPPGTRNRFTPSSDEELCAFNYKDGNGEQCDIGVITVNELQVTYTPATDTEPPIRKAEVVQRQIDCSGKVYNCVKGPTKIMNPGYTRFTEITKTELNKDYKDEYKYDGLIGTGNGIFEYANFRRNLSNTNIDYVSSFGNTPAYKSVWADPIFGKIFEPRVVDFFANNKMLNNTDPLIEIDPGDPTTLLEVEARKNNTTYHKPLAADPFMGLGANVNPFYTFYCFDTAFDMKARIRMVVRDWDRIFPSSNSELELLSDLFRGSSARQDAPELVEFPNDNDVYIMFNDKWDWDDMVPMDRTPGSFDANATIWRPTPTVAFPDGWFNPSRFPNTSNETE